jgi:DNA polymerase I-like protein with 3'-5' exonuclease and polymerase domains
MTYQPPSEFPTVPHGAVIAVDTETCDPDLTTLGPGFITRGSYPIGISLAFDGYKEYFPIAHSKDNCEINVVDWFQALLSRPDLTMVGANTKYDIEALWKAGITPKCMIDDIQIRDALIDENNSSYSLAAIAGRRKLGAKTSSPMEQWMISHGLVLRGKPDYARLREVPPSVVGPYAAQDAALTLAIYNQQIAEIAQDDLQRVVDLESRLIPILFKMRLNGIRVDVSRAEQINEEFTLKLKTDLDQFKGVDPYSSASITKYINKTHHIAVPQTEKGNDSISNEWLKSTGHSDLIALAEYRQNEKFRRDFIEGVILEGQFKGRLHPQWFSARGSSFMNPNDTNGTKSGRLACTMPNLQQIPARHPVNGPLVRSLFLPEEGEHFLSADYQAQEIRMGIHFAAELGLPGASDMAQRYNENPMLDYHTETMNLINARGGMQVTRFQAKTANLSIQYGVGKKKLAGFLDMNTSQIEEFMNVYNAANQYIKLALTKADRIAQDRGYVKTILGRRRHFNEYENAQFGSAWEKPLTKHAALAKWAFIKRAGTYKAWNSVIQGSSAEMAKLAIVAVANEGIIPLMTVHDELNMSISDPSQVPRIKELLENVLKLNVPIVVTHGIGKNWSEAH